MNRAIIVIILIVIQLFFSKFAFAGTCDYPSFCNTMPRTGADPSPGQNCIINGVTNNGVTNETTYGYHYGTSNACGFFDRGFGACVPRCGLLGVGWCCDPDNKSNVPPDTTNLKPPPCENNIGSTNNAKQCNTVNTSLGLIQTDIPGLTKSLFAILLGLAGGVAILLIIAGGYQLMMSQGNPEKVKEARERIIAAIVGLIFILFSVTILQIIGVNILQIPGFKG